MRSPIISVLTFTTLLFACGPTRSTPQTSGEPEPPGDEALPSVAAAIGAPGTLRALDASFEWPAEVVEVLLEQRCYLLEEDTAIDWDQCRDHMSASLLQLAEQGPPALVVTDGISHIVGGTGNQHQLFVRHGDRYRYIGELIDEPVLTDALHGGLPDLRVSHDVDCDEVYLYVYDGAAYREQSVQGCDEDVVPEPAPEPVVDGRCTVTQADDGGEGEQAYTYDAQGRWTSIATYYDGEPPMTVWTYRDDGTVAIADGYGDEVTPVGVGSVERGERQVTLRYEPSGDQTEVATVALHLDGAGRVVRVVQGGAETRCSYDRAGRLVERVGDASTETFRYRRGRLLSSRETTTAESPRGVGVTSRRVARRSESEVEVRETLPAAEDGPMARTVTYRGRCVALLEPRCFVGAQLLPPTWPAN